MILAGVAAASLVGYLIYKNATGGGSDDKIKEVGDDSSEPVVSQ